MASIAGAVLAAGSGTRMGRPKAELVVDRARLVDRAVSALRAGGCDPVVAVVRAGTDVPGARVVVNPDPARGMRSSLALALDAAGDPDALAVLLVDLPGVSAAAVAAVVSAWRPGRIAVGRYSGHRGHPTVMAPALWREALALAGPDEGARALLIARPELVDDVAVAGDPTDLDAPDDLAAWTSAQPMLALLPSPLLGPATWEPVALALSDAGWTASTVPRPQRAPSTPGAVLEAYLDGIPDDRDVVAVAHSNAGLYLPQLCPRRRIVGCLFVDAGLPPRSGSVPLAPKRFRAMLARLADRDGLLPPWTQWWGAEADKLFPSAAMRARIEREQSRLPLAYFDESLPVPDRWDARPCAYLAFGDTYSGERDEAAARGWPVRTLRGGHLHTVVDPAEVAAALDTLLRELGLRRPSVDQVFPSDDRIRPEIRSSRGRR